MNPYRPFAITARTAGCPRKLVTPLVVMNLDPASGLVAATVNAFWDTGSEPCLMSRNLAAILGIRYEKENICHGLTGSCVAAFGYACVSLVCNGDIIDTIAAVVDETSPTGEYSFIIGMDFIRKGTLSVSSTPLHTVLSFKIRTDRPIDFIAEADADTDVKYLPLSSTKEEIRPVFGQEAIKLLNLKH